jgi:hypothetical protein
MLGVAEDVFAVEIWDGNSTPATVWRVPRSAADSG